MRNYSYFDAFKMRSLLPSCLLKFFCPVVIFNKFSLVSCRFCHIFPILPKALWFKFFKNWYIVDKIVSNLKKSIFSTHTDFLSKCQKLQVMISCSSSQIIVRYLLINYLKLAQKIDTAAFYFTPRQKITFWRQKTPRIWIPNDYLFSIFIKLSSRKVM